MGGTSNEGGKGPCKVGTIVDSTGMGVVWVVLVIKGKSTMQSRHYCFVRDGRGTSGVRKTLTAYGGKTYF